MERIFQQAQLRGAETSTKINDLFRQYVQYQDMVKDVEMQIHYGRGALDAYGELMEFIKQTQRHDSDREKLEQERKAYLESQEKDDGHKDEDDIPSKKEAKS